MFSQIYIHPIYEKPYVISLLKYGLIHLLLTQQILDNKSKTSLIIYLPEYKSLMKINNTLATHSYNVVILHSFLGGIVM